MKFSIVIPALNEEKAVQSILRRSLAAAPKIKGAGLGFDDVEVILVNDGSKDATPRLAREVAGVRVIDHPVNRGYGAAIKTGFEASSGDWVSFIDADGTCDPDFFVDLLKLAKERSLDVACGSRMHEGSKMPPVRVLGNWLFRTLVNLIAGSSVADVASGMRVIRRDALERLYPLPDGLNFTPAMSVRALLDTRLKIGEKPMPYEERVGRSKLSVVKDGLRFLGIILDTAITYRPLVFFGAASLLLTLVALWSLVSRWGGPAAPLPYYLENHRLEDWMIFRVAFCTILLSIAAFALALGTVAQSLVAIVNQERKPRGLEAFVDAALGGKFVPWGIAAIVLAFWVNRRLLASYLATGTIPDEFWVFPLAGGLCALIGAEFIAFGLVGRIIRLLRERERARELRKPR